MGLDHREKKSHLQIVSSFVSETAPQLPSEQVFYLFMQTKSRIHED